MAVARQPRYSPRRPPSVLYTFFVMPTMPSLASSAVNAPVPPIPDAMLAVAIDNRARTRSRGYVATAISYDVKARLTNSNDTCTSSGR